MVGKRFRSNIITTLLTLGCLVGCSGNGEITPENKLAKHIDAYLQPLEVNREFSGVVRVVKGNEVLYNEVFGHADIEKEIAHSLDSRFAIASITKAFTAAAIVKLKDEGHLTYDDYVGEHLPGFAHGDEIQVRHLLRFESGLADFETDDHLSSAELLEEIGSRPLEFSPGSESKYGNAGFDVLAILVEQISGLSFDEYLQEAFFNTIGMSASGLRKALASDQDVLVAPHVPSAPPNLITKTSYFNPFNMFGAGGMYSTAEDLSLWGMSIIKKQLVDVWKEDYPWGWGRTEIAGHSGLSQTGMQPGFTSSIQLFPEEELVIVLLNNIESGMWTGWGADIARIYFGEEPVISHEPYEYLNAPPNEALRYYQGRYKLRPDRYVDIKARDGQLWVHLNDYHVGRYMLPLSDGGFQMRDFTGRIYFHKTGAEYADSLTWKLPASWNAEDEVYIRSTSF